MHSIRKRKPLRQSFEVSFIASMADQMAAETQATVAQEGTRLQQYAGTLAHQQVSDEQQVGELAIAACLVLEWFAEPRSSGALISGRKDVIVDSFRDNVDAR